MQTLQSVAWLLAESKQTPCAAKESACAAKESASLMNRPWRGTAIRLCVINQKSVRVHAHACLRTCVHVRLKASTLLRLLPAAGAPLLYGSVCVYVCVRVCTLACK